MIPHPTPLGRRLRALRTTRGLTLTQLAALAGISAAVLSALERGRQHATSTDRAARIADALGTDPFTLWPMAERAALPCRVCGGPLLTVDPGLTRVVRRRFACNACQLARRQARDRARYAAPPISCADCGGVLPARPRRVRFCADCRRAHQREAQARCYKRRVWGSLPRCRDCDGPVPTTPGQPAPTVCPPGTGCRLHPAWCAA